MLGAQTFSLICLFFWGLIVTYPILWCVNKILPIRLQPIDEIKGADLVEHYMGDENDIPLSAHQLAQIANYKLGGVPQVSFHVPASPYPRHNEFDSVVTHRKPFQANVGYEHDDNPARNQQTTEHL